VVLWEKTSGRRNQETGADKIISAVNSSTYTLRDKKLVTIDSWVFRLIAWAILPASRKLSSYPMTLLRDVLVSSAPQTKLPPA
jgi:hypothetical protein